jgi:hypothetical protein
MTRNDISMHLQASVTAARVETTPRPHAVIGTLLPAPLYEDLLASMPAPEQFEHVDRYKSEFCPSEPAAGTPARAIDAWSAFEREVVGDLLAPLLVARFRPFIDALYQDLFGPLAPEALSLPLQPFRGRLLLRRPGYRLRAHRDKKIAALTGLIYCARPGDRADYGTDLYAVDRDVEAPHLKTFYPEDAGARMRLVRSVPFQANAALVFLNGRGMAHGAAIPPESPQAERYAYQFYIGPPRAEFVRLVRALSAEARDAVQG